jgi:hypothetical protein
MNYLLIRKFLFLPPVRGLPVEGSSRFYLLTGNFHTKTGTLAAVNYFKTRMKVIEVDGQSRVEETAENLMRVLACS